MICKMVFGNSFQGCLDYIIGRYDPDKHTKILAHSDGIPDMDNKSVAQIFEAYARKGGHNIEKPVGHFAYSFHKNDASRITDELMVKIMREHMELLGIRDTEFIFGRHYDTDHEHGHLMFSMIDNHGNVIGNSMIYARNKRICKYLTKKYGLTMSSDKRQVNRDKLQGKEKLKYEFYDKVMKCKLQSSTWREFDNALKAAGLRLRFHYNNVTGQLMGVTFTDGKYSFSGRQLDKDLKLDSLINEFGDIKKCIHGEIKGWYNMKHRSYDRNDEKESSMYGRDFRDIFPDIPQPPNFSIPDLLSSFSEKYYEKYSPDYTPSENGKTGFVSYSLLYCLLFMPYGEQITMGGGGGGNNRGWRDDDEDEKERLRNRNNNNKPIYKPKRR